MTRELLALICCPACKADLTLTVAEASEHSVQEGMLTCTRCLGAYPIRRGVPRFVQSDGYVRSFSFEWSRWSRVQFDPANGTTESEDTFRAKTGLTPDDVREKLVLDVGCGAGRFLDVASRWGGRVVGVDFSYAVDASQRNVGARPNVDIVQADIFALPFREDTFDVIFSIGVLHHTSDTQAAFAKLPPLLKDKGQLAVWLYYYTDPLHKAASDFWRAIFCRVPSRLAYAWCWMLVVLFSGLFRSRLVEQAPFSYLPRLIPLSTHPSVHWRVLDTFDWWTPRFQDKECSPSRVIGWFREAGLRGIDLLNWPTAVKGIRDAAATLPALGPTLQPLHKGRIVIFGCGAGGAEAIRQLGAMGFPHRIVAICDNDRARHGTLFNGLRVSAFEALDRKDYDFVIVASVPGERAISRQLREAGLVPKRDFGSLDYVRDTAGPACCAAA